MIALPPLTDRTRVIIGRSMAAPAVLVGLASAVTLLATGHWEVAIDAFPIIAIAIGFGALAWKVLPTEPSNGAIWALSWAAFLSAADMGSNAAQVLLDSVPDDFEGLLSISASELPLTAAILLWPGRWAWIPGIFLFGTTAIQLFPDGRLPSRRWRWVAWLSGVAMAVPTLLLAILWFPTSGFTYDSGFGPTAEAIEGVALLACVVLLCVSIAGLLRRYRHSGGEVRSQIRAAVFGLTSAFVLSLTGLLVDLAVSGDAVAAGAEVGNNFVEPVLDLMAFSLLIVSFVVAVVKYRLYDLDVIISKTATYLTLAAFIAAVYVGLVVGVSGLIGDRSSLPLSIAATTLIAIAFQPVRRVVQRAANRVVFGKRSSHYEVLARFSQRAVDSSDEELIARVPRLIVDGTSASAATLWVSVEGGFQVAGSWPEVDQARAASLNGDGTFLDEAADRSIPIRHDDELLGGLSVIVARGETITPRDEALLADLAAGLGLALRNARLTARLRERVAELEASRLRVVAAADEARQALEHDLDLGPQRQLLALERSIGSTRSRAEQVGADQLAGMLAGLESEAVEATRTVRDFARGVYPPLLASDGLAAAITRQTADGPISVSVDDQGVERHSREVEAAVYFAVLEALQNAAKHAQGATALVTLAEVDGELVFGVRDDGCGFDVANVVRGAGLGGLADRLDTVGGQVAIDSALGQGTSVTGSVPIVDPPPDNRAERQLVSA